MKQKLYQIDAFTDKVFSGNPAAVCPLEQWLSDDLPPTGLTSSLREAETYLFQKQENC